MNSDKERNKLEKNLVLSAKIITPVFLVMILVVSLLQDNLRIPGVCMDVLNCATIIIGVIFSVIYIILFVLEMKILVKQNGLTEIAKVISELILISVFMYFMDEYLFKTGGSDRYLLGGVAIGMVIVSRGISYIRRMS